MSEYDYVDEIGSMPDGDDAPTSSPDELYAEQQTPPAPPLVIEDLTLAQAIGLLIYRPVRAGQELWRVIAPTQNGNKRSYSQRSSLEQLQAMGANVPPSVQAADGYVPVPDNWESDDTSDGRFLDVQERNWLLSLWRLTGLDREQLLLTALLALSLLFAFLGAGILRDSATDPIKREAGDTGGSIFWLFMSAAMYISYAVYISRDWWRARISGKALPVEEDPVQEPVQPSLFDDEAVDDDADTRPLIEQIFGWVERQFVQLTLVPIALLMSYLAYARNVVTDAEGTITGIVFTSFGFTMWVMAMLTWSIIFAVDINQLIRRIPNLRLDNLQLPEPQIRWRWSYIVLIAIMLLAGYFRLNMLDDVPSDMTSDHIEKLIDATRVNDGVYAVFFANNGGREAFQMYAVAAIAEWFDVGFNFRALKFATIIEGMLTIFLSYWVAKEIIGRDTPEQRQLGEWVGLGSAALMAVSFWHVMLSRLGLRIALTPLTVLIVLYFLVRAIRDNRRSDFVWMGLALGVGTYFYQANRMLPILVVAGIGLAMLFNTNLKFSAIFRYGYNLAIAGLIAIVAYLPMYHYSQVYELEFWNRTYGRIFGENVFRCVNEATGLEELCTPSNAELLELLNEPRYGFEEDMTAYEALQRNYAAALTSFMYDGERQWITNVGGNPALDARTAALYMLGFLMWVAMAIRRRDVALAVVPIGIFVLVIPSALAIAPGLRENPSFTRISGTAPLAFMMAALPLGVLAMQIAKAGRERLPYYAISLLLVFSLVRDIAFTNFDIFFNDYRTNYTLSWRPYSEISAPLAEYVESGGSFGNAFYVNYPHWLDHRILGSVAGDLTWPNGLFEAPDVYGIMAANQGTPYEYDPTKPILFYIHPLDVDDIAFLQQQFPNGQLRFIEIVDDTSFYVYEVPAGLEWLANALTTETVQQGCIINCLPGPR